MLCHFSCHFLLFEDSTHELLLEAFSHPGSHWAELPTGDSMLLLYPADVCSSVSASVCVLVPLHEYSRLCLVNYESLEVETTCFPSSHPLFLAPCLAQPRDSVNNWKWTSLWMSGPSPFLFTKSSLFGSGLWDHFFIWAPIAFAFWMLTWHFSCAALLGCYLYDILFLQLNVIFFKVGLSCLVLHIYSFIAIWQILDEIELSDFCLWKSFEWVMTVLFTSLTLSRILTYLHHCVTQMSTVCSWA